MKINKKKIIAALTTSSVSLMFAASAAHAATWQAGDTKMNFYGYAKLDIIYDVDSDLGDAVIRQQLRLDKDKGPNGHFNMHANQSRLGLTTSTPTDKGDLFTMIEFDFYGNPFDRDTSSQVPRLRRAFGQWNGWLVGQTFSNYGMETAYMPTLDFFGQPGGAGGRVAQIRYTKGPFAVSLEDPEMGGGYSRGVAYDKDGLKESGFAVSNMPTLALSVNDKRGKFSYVAATQVRQLQFYVETDNNGVKSDKTKSAQGWGILLQGVYAITDRTTVRMGVNHGEGLGGSTHFNTAAPAYYNNAKNKLELIETTSLKGSISHKVWKGTINLGYSQVMNSVDDKAMAMKIGSAGRDKTLKSGHLNYMWSPAPRVMVGFEVGHHIRKQHDNEKGSATRLQSSFQLSF